VIHFHNEKVKWLTIDLMLQTYGDAWFVFWTGFLK